MNEIELKIIETQEQTIGYLLERIHVLKSTIASQDILIEKLKERDN